MFWYKVPFGKKNFGDVLGPYIVRKLSGKEVAYIPLLHQGLNKKTLLTYPIALYSRKLNLKDLWDNIKFLFGKNKSILITVGSIIGWHSSPKCNIWGSGIMDKKGRFNNANFYAVRGKETQSRMRELGYKVPMAIGDPAVLMPLLYIPKENKKYKLGIIPHHFHHNEINTKIESDEIKLISLLDEIEEVIDQIASCDILISSSLHGIIIAHAYNKPCIWYNLSQKTIGGDNIKFVDYFSSVDIKPYDAIDLKIDVFNEKTIDLINEHAKIHKEIFEVNFKNISILQANLIKSAPFPVLEKYLKLVNTTIDSKIYNQ